MVTKQYIPEKRDLIWLTFDSAQGHEQRGRRPALVVTPSYYNKKTGLALMCPITSNKKGYPFEIEVQGEKIEGVVLADHIKSLDWNTREAEFVEKISEKTFQRIIKKLNLLINNS